DLVEVTGALEVFAEGFFTDHAGPFAVGTNVQSALAEHDHDVVEKFRGGGEVEQAVGGGPTFLVEFVEQDFEGLVAFQVEELATMVMDGLTKAGPDGFIVALAGILAIGFLEFVAELLIGFVAAGKTDDFELGWQITTCCEIVKRGDELTMSQVARGAEDDNGARLCAMTREKRFLERIFDVGHGIGLG